MKFSKWIFLFLIVSTIAWADDVIPTDQFFSQVLDLVKSFGGLSWGLKIAGIITIVISSMKVSFVKPLWDSLGWAKGLAWAILALIAAVVSLPKESMTLPGFAAFLFAGAGSLILHELLDAIKGIPGIGPAFVSVINFVESMLQSPDAQK